MIEGSESSPMDLHPTLKSEAQASFDANLGHLTSLTMKREEFTEKMDAVIRVTFMATVERLRHATTSVVVYENLLCEAEAIDRHEEFEEFHWAKDYYLSRVGMSEHEIHQMGSARPFSQNHRPGIFPIQWEGFLWGPYPPRGEGVVYLLHREDSWLASHVVYVGYTTNMRERMKVHRKQKRGLFTGVSFIRCDSPEDAYRLEGDLIYQHQPELNIQDRQNRRSGR